MYDILIVGAGPAGLTAALYALRARMKVLLCDKMAPGGYLGQIQDLENYPGFSGGISGFDLAQNMVNQLKHYEYNFKQVEIINIAQSEDGTWKVKAKNDEFISKTLIIATGSNPRLLGVDGEKEFTGRGVSYCGVCDAPFFRNKEVVCIGGGNTALEEALHLTKFASKVTIIHRRNALRADKILQERAKTNEKISFIMDAHCVKISGQKSVSEVSLKYNDGKAEQIPTQGVFIFVGMDPQTGFLQKLVKTRGGYILTDEKLSTNASGIFACGDCRNIPLRQVITACGEGAIAAYSARNFIEHYD